jgi:hypothetical protein
MVAAPETGLVVIESPEVHLAEGLSDDRPLLPRRALLYGLKVILDLSIRLDQKLVLRREVSDIATTRFRHMLVADRIPALTLS